jgi:hypothetical protein
VLVGLWLGCLLPWLRGRRAGRPGLDRIGLDVRSFIHSFIHCGTELVLLCAGTFWQCTLCSEWWNTNWQTASIADNATPH